jgi:hypothetical protein
MVRSHTAATAAARKCWPDKADADGQAKKGDVLHVGARGKTLMRQQREDQVICSSSTEF